ncbi:hypothetical protein U9M48_034861 [Paspalum notatum var. saurae]|uniref:RING-type E3 ubiquitin transferase n=1 Tax=Paspalum notatum var. saurae TaxID=547442 RepID=A0AAQ3UDJ3_PASNO
MGAGGVSPSMALALAGFCFSLIFIAFVCSRLACALLRRRRARRARRAPALPLPLPLYSPSPAVHAASGGAGAGLDPAAVAALPARAFSAASAADAESQCVICLAEYEEEDMLRTLPHCGHNFHMACIDLWLEQNTTCPVCRISLLDNADSEHTSSEHTAAAAAAALPPPPVPSSVATISPPSSPESPRSDPCRCLFVSSGGHSSRASAEAPPRHEPDQENQAASGPASADGATTTMPLSEVNLNPPTENIGQAVRKQVDRSTQLGPCK